MVYVISILMSLIVIDIINKEFARLPGNFRTVMKKIPENLRKSILVYIDNNIELEKFA